MEPTRPSALYASMCKLNGPASRAALAVGARCATDVTGFGLLGHASHIAEASGVTLRIDPRRVPSLPGAREALGVAAREPAAPSAMRPTSSRASTWNDAADGDRALLIDPQTSGGLLVAVPRIDVAGVSFARSRRPSRSVRVLAPSVTVSCLRDAAREWMEPGGSHGLQNRSRPDDVGLGGFDSHALPPASSSHARARTHRSMNARNSRTSVRRLAPLLVATGICASPLCAQRADSTRTAAAAVPPAAAGDALKPPIGPRRAFLYSFLVPGSCAGVLGRHKAAAAFMLVEAISLAMIRESAADVHEARRIARRHGRRRVRRRRRDKPRRRIVVPPRFNDAYVQHATAHVEDWVALLVANHLFAGADAFVAAHLWDVPGATRPSRSAPAAERPSRASFKW